MRIIMTALCAGLLAGCLPKGEANIVVVDGEGVVLATPEIFTLDATLQANESTREAALADISSSLERITSELPRLDGLQRIEIDPSSATVEPVRDFTCAELAEYRQRDACPITGYVAKVELKATGAPAGVAGNALSLLTQFGAIEVELKGYSVVDYDAAKSEAASLAMKNARAKAERPPAAAGSKLGAPTRIQYGEGFDRSEEPPPAAFAPSEDEIVVTGSRITPAVNLVLTPQPFEVREQETAAFALNGAGS